MATVYWTSEAECDMLALPPKAQTRVYKLVGNLEIFPRMGRALPGGKTKGYRQFPVSPYIVVYRVVTEGGQDRVYLNRIWDGRRGRLPRG